MLKKCLNTKISKGRAKEYRCKITGTHLIKTEFSTGSIEKLNIIIKLIKESLSDFSKKFISSHRNVLSINLFLTIHGSLE